MRSLFRADVGDNMSTKTQLERRWKDHYSTIVNTLSQYHLADEAGVGGGTDHLYPTRYLTIQGVPRRRKSYVALQNNLWNLFDRPPNPRLKITPKEDSAGSPRRVSDDDPIVNSVTVQNINERFTAGGGGA